MFKKLLPYGLAIIIAVGIFIAGLTAGIHFFASIKTTTMLQDRFIDSTQLMSVLHYLDQGDVEKARQFLVLQQDSTILSINALADHADKESYGTACRILKIIGKNRKDNPSNYKNYAYGSGVKKSDDIKKEVALILDKWATASCDKIR